MSRKKTVRKTVKKPRQVRYPIYQEDSWDHPRNVIEKRRSPKKLS